MLLTNQNIEQLLLLCSSGNAQAQQEVYNRYYHAMYNTAYRIVKDSYKAEDVMQESFLTAFTKLESLNDSNVFGAWLKRIVVNTSIADYNKTSKVNTTPLDNLLYKVEDASGLQEEDLCSTKVKQVMTAMKQLKPNYNLSLTLYLIEGYDYEEISEIMNISYANCRTMISRAKEKLRQILLTEKVNY
ncbi:RNA polymerase sigma factor [Winogradskyella maritima]|uniref:RNA polymerase sigma factor n=1 Tax=Winogradskyella maritima TaxID=1517766 RepID=A0ABV8AHV3_9FLAO|nr:RNA polymerase sigma factor [Winogradskyella maritima]